MELLILIVKDTLISLYRIFGLSVVIAVLFMFAWKHYHSIKEAVREWIGWFKTETHFRKMFLLVIYSVMILGRTLLNRDLWMNPVHNVIGVWGLYNNEGKLTTEVPENLALFIPFTILLLWTYRERIIGEEVRLTRVLWQSTKIVFIFSFTIEMLQLFLRLGTWQLSDLFYNTLGSFIGGLIYWIGYRIQKHNKHNKT